MGRRVVGAMRRDDVSGGLGRLAVTGALWLGLVNLLSKGTQVAVTLALGVYLNAAELGTVTIAVVVLNLGVVLQSAGVYDVIARTTEEPLRFAGTVATLSVGVGSLVAVAVALLAPQLARLVGAPEAASLLRVIMVSLPFTAYAGVQMGYLHRGLDFRRRMLPDAGSALVGAGVTVVAAATGAGTWSLVAGIVTTAVLAPFLGALVGLRIPLRWSTHHARQTLSWASTTAPAAVLGVLLLNIDYIVISRSLGDAATGVYSFAFRIAYVPYVMIAVVLGGVAFPVYARLMRTGGRGDVAAAMVTFVHVVVALTGGAYLGLALLADRIVVVDQRWADSAEVLQVLCPYGFLLGLVLTGYEVLRASGRPGLYLRAEMAHLLLLAGGAVLLVRFGVLGVAAAQSVAALVTAGLVVWMLARTDLLAGGLGAAVVRPGLAAVTVAAGHHLTAAADLLPPADDLLGGLVVGAAVAAAYGVALVLFDRPLIRDLAAALRSRGGQPAGAHHQPLEGEV